MSRYVKGASPRTVAAIDTELEEIEVAIGDTLSRKGDTPNQMEADLDMNSNRVTNLPKPTNSNEPARLLDVTLALQDAGFATTVNTIERTGRKLVNVAHRGWRDCYPQNTLLAMSSALRRGADALETDLQVTSDGNVVLFHDDVVTALTNGTGAVKDQTLATLQALTFDETAGTVFSEARIPLFSEFLKYASRNDVDIYPEIKKYRTQADIALMVAEILTYKMEDRTVLASFNMSDLTAARTYDATIGLGFLGSSTVQATYEGYVDSLVAIGGRTMLLYNYTALLSTPAIATYALANNVEIGAWTVDDNTAAKELIGLGVKNIITDIPLETR